VDRRVLSVYGFSPSGGWRVDLIVLLTMPTPVYFAALTGVCYTDCTLRVHFFACTSMSLFHKKRDQPSPELPPQLNVLKPELDFSFRKSALRQEQLLQRRKLHKVNHVQESEAHRRFKVEIFEGLQAASNVRDVFMERPLGTVRPDVSAVINGVPVAIEIQISFLSMETIIYRTIEYARKGIYVLWLLQWKPEIDRNRYIPKIWERWIHAAYFGRVYYWVEGLNVVSYHFETHYKSIRETFWYSPDGTRKEGGGYSKKLKRCRTPVRGGTFNLAADFAGRERTWWEASGVKVPDAKLYMCKQHIIPEFRNKP
jgi:competence protein CoiA